MSFQLKCSSVTGPKCWSASSSAFITASMSSTGSRPFGLVDLKTTLGAALTMCRCLL